MTANRGAHWPPRPHPDKIGMTMLKTNSKKMVILAALVCGLSPWSPVTAKQEAGRIVVANRTANTLSIIDTRTDTLIKTVSVAAPGARPPEPMYLGYSAKYRRIYVCDRANRQVVALDASTYRLVNTAPIGAGAFHMWMDKASRQLWVVNDIDKTLSVIHPGTMKVLATVPIPQDLTEKGGKPHDVIVDPAGKAVFVTVIGVSGASDFVVRFSTRTFQETARRAVGKDPHVGLPPGSKNLFVPAQDANTVYVLNAKNLEVVKELRVPGAHGAAWTPDGKYFFTSNLPGSTLPQLGNDALWAIDTKALKIVGHTPMPDDPELEVPHNIAISGGAENKLYLTHSGHDDGDAIGDITIYAIAKADPTPRYLKKVTVGLNPFGILYYRLP